MTIWKLGNWFRMKLQPVHCKCDLLACKATSYFPREHKVIPVSKYHVGMLLCVLAMARPRVARAPTEAHASSKSSQVTSMTAMG
jgi:hypothetical protein